MAEFNQDLNGNILDPMAEPWLGTVALDPYQLASSSLNINNPSAALSSSENLEGIPLVDASYLADSELGVLVDAALQRWSESGLLSLEAHGSDLFRFQVADLGDGLLGKIEGQTITLDDDGGGYGWFIDSTPEVDEEFALSDGQFVAIAADASGKIDLLTVILHEIGHGLGFGHLDEPFHLMAENLGTSERRLIGEPNHYEIAQNLGGIEYLIAAPPTGIKTELEIGLEAVSSALDDLIEGANLSEDELGSTTDVFGQLVPGIVRIDDNGAIISPQLRDLLSIDININNNFNGTAPTSIDNSNDLAAIFNYVDGLFSFGDFSVEQALDAIDLNDDDQVSIKEALDVLIVGQVQSFFNSYIGGAFSDDLESFLVGLSLPNVLSSVVDFDINGATVIEKGNDLAYDLNFSLTFSQSELLDLGAEADDLGIRILDNQKVSVDRSIHFSSLIFGFNGAKDGTVAGDGSDFFFAAPDGFTVGLNIAETNLNFNLNVGFLGAEVNGGDVTLAMTAEAIADDPSNPDALGFSRDQQGVASTTGVIIADNFPDFTDSSLNDNFSLNSDIVFTLKIGSQANSPVFEITLESSDTSDNATLADLISDLQQAIANVDPNLANIISITESGGKLEFRLPDVNPEPLGLNSQISGFETINAGSSPTILGNTDPDIIEFLLAIDGGTPQLISVTTTPVGDNADDKLTLAGLLIDLNNALVGTGVTATNNGGVIQLFISGKTLEITQTLTLDTVEEITIEELASGTVLDVVADQTSRFEVDFTVETLNGLEKAGSTDPFEPTGTIKVDINPFDNDPNDANADVKVVQVETTIEPFITERISYSLTDSADVALVDGTSDMQPLLDFNVVSAAQVLGLIYQVGSWLDRLEASDLLNAFDIPFADLTLGQLLDFKDLIDKVLIFDDTDATDQSRLLELLGENKVLSFDTAQELEVRLAEIFDHLGFYDSHAEALEAIDASYDPIAKDLTYNLNLTHQFIEKTVDLDFDMNLEPLVNIFTEGQVKLESSGTFNWVMGLRLGDSIAALDPATSTLDTLNADLGVAINDHLAVSSLGVIAPAVGRLSADASFTLVVTGGSQPSYNITLTAADTADNKTLADLIDDLNAQLIGTGIEAQANDEGDRLQLVANDVSITAFSVNSESWNTAFTELGFQPKTAVDDGGDLILEAVVDAVVSYELDEDATFTIEYLDNGLKTVNVTLFAAETTGNRSIYELAGNLNTAINAAFGGASNNPFITTIQGGKLVFGLKIGDGSGAALYDTTGTIDNDLAPIAANITSFSFIATNNAAVDSLQLATAVGDADKNTADFADFIIYASDGQSYRIDLSSLRDPDSSNAPKLVGTIQELIDLIDTQTSGNITLELGDDQASFRLIDNNFVGTNTELFRVELVNGSPAAVQLGIFGSDTNSLVVTQDSSSSLSTPDGRIQGTKISSVDLFDRFFIGNPDNGDILTAELTISTVDQDGLANTPDATAEASFGFAGVRLFTLDQNQQLFTADAGIGFAQDKIFLGDLFTALGNLDDLRDLVALPTLVSNGDFSFGVEIYPDLSSLINLPNTAEINFQINDLGQLVDDGLGGLNLELPDIAISGTDLEALANFDAIQFDNILDALRSIADFLQQFESFSFLQEDIPLLGLSIDDLLDLGDRFLEAVEDIEQNPAGGIQLLAQALGEAFNLPDLSDPGTQAAFFAALGIPDASELIAFSLVDNNDADGDTQDLLRVDLRLPIGFSEGLSVALDIGDIEFLEKTLHVDLQGGAGLATSGYLDARLSFGVDLDTPTNLYLFDDATRIAGGLTASANNLEFVAALGPLGLFIRDGSAVIDISFGLNNGSFDLNSDSRVLISDIGTVFALYNPELEGTVNATLPVFVPTEDDFLGDIVLTLSGANALTLNGDGLQLPDFTDPGVLQLPDFSNIDLDSINPFGGNIALMLDGLDFLLMGLQDVIDGEIFGFELPLIGDSLAGGVDFIESLRQDILAPIRQFVDQAPELGSEIVQALLYSLLGEGSDGISISNPFGAGTVDLTDFLGLSGEITGLDLLVDYETGSSDDGDISLDDLVASIGDGDDDFMWLFRLGGSFTPSVDVNFDLGFDALGLEVDTDLDVSIAWDLALGLGISLTEGAYLYIGDHRQQENANDDAELRLTLEVKVLDGSDVTDDSEADDPDLKGTLAFLQLDADPSAIDDPDLEQDDIHFHAEFAVDLIEQGAVDTADAQKLTFSELGSLGFDTSLKADAEVNLNFEAKFNEDILPDTISALLPSVQGRFVLDWEMDDVFSEDFSLADSLNLLAFRDVGIDMGSFLGDFLGPVVEKIAEITEPLQPIIDVVTTPIPVVSDLAGQPITLIDLAGMTGYVEPAMIYAIADIIELINKIASVVDGGAGELIINLGDFDLINLDAGIGDGDLASNLSLPTFDLSQADNFDLNNALNNPNVDNLISAGTSFLDALNSGSNSGSQSTRELSAGLVGGTDAAASGFKFPLFEDPALIFGLLLGRDVDLVTYDLAPFGFDFSYTQKFPIWGPLFARLSLSAGIMIDLAFGYDTAGAREFYEGNFENPLDLLAGFFVADNNIEASGAVGTTDIPELILSGELFAGAELNAGVASAGVEGGLILQVLFDLYDPDRDGKVRIDELVGNFLYEANYGNPLLAPLAIFDVTGSVAAQLRAFIEIFAIIDTTFDITPPITLVEFEIPFEREPILATERGDGSLLINMGENAAQRLNGDVRDIDETIYVKSISANEVKVWGMGIQESTAQTYTLGENKLITIYGGAGNDYIDLSGVTHSEITFEVQGGVGNDTIIGGAGVGTYRGNEGDDTITGGASADLIEGGDGNDTLDGAGGADIIFGDTGSLSFNRETGEKTRIRSFVSDQDGIDAIAGGAGADIIFGGGNRDSITGDEGDDLILGDGGSFEFVSGQIPTNNGFIDVSLITARGDGDKDQILGNAGKDTIFGGASDDFIDGGADQDVIDGGVGFDTLYGGSHADYIFGGDNDDVIFGFRDAVVPDEFDADVGDVAVDLGDYIEGQAGNDYIRGNAGDDTIHGNRGADILFGDEGNDTIGAGTLIEPWHPEVEIFDSEAGADIIFGGADSDTIDAGDNSDVVFGDDGLVVYLNAYNAAVTPFTTIGSRERTDSTGLHRLIGDGAESLIAGYDSEDDNHALTRDLLVTETLATDGSDTIIGGNGNDIIFGGGSDETALDEADRVDQIFGDFDPANVPAGPRPSGQDTLIGDGGRVELFDRRNQAIRAVSNQAQDGVDWISGNDLGDYIFGGGGSDLIWGFAAASFGNEPLAGLTDNDVILGDNGSIEFDANDAANRIQRIFTTVENDDQTQDSGASDQIQGNFGDDVILGGLNSSFDVIEGNLGNDIILGDNGILEFSLDGDLGSLDLIRSYTDGFGGTDHLAGNEGNDIVLGGTGGDEIFGDDAIAASGAADGQDILLGDNGDIALRGTEGQLLAQVAAMDVPSGVELIVTTDTTEFTGGADAIAGNAGSDVILGGVNNGGEDVLYGDAASQGSHDGDDLILGDNGLLHFNYDWQADDNLSDANFTPADDHQLTLDLVRSFADGLGGKDRIAGDVGNDLLIGGNAGDEIYGDNASATAGALDGDDIALGDNGDVFLTGDVGDRLVLNSAVEKIVTSDQTEATGGADLIEGNAGEDIILGGVNNGGIDQLYGDAQIPATDLDGNDVILGDNGRLDFAYNDTDLHTLDLIQTQARASDNTILGGTDQIFGNAGGDTLLGGSGADLMIGDNSEVIAGSGIADRHEANAGADILIGDQGAIERINDLVARIETTDQTETEGGADTIQGNDFGDIILGGVDGDRLHGETELVNGLGVADLVQTAGNDIILGDEGVLRYDLDANNGVVVDGVLMAGDNDPSTLDLIRTFATGSLGAADEIFGNDGSDIVMGGTAGDTIFGDFYEDDLSNKVAAPNPGMDTLLGDGGEMTFIDAAVTLLRTIEPDQGGADVIQGNDYDDVIMGGFAGDELYGETTTELQPLLSGRAGDDTILGDNARMDWILPTDQIGDRPDVSLHLGGDTVTLDGTTADPSSLDRIMTTNPTLGGDDVIYGNGNSASDAGDVIFGGTGHDAIRGDSDDQGDGIDGVDGQDLLFGDHGKIYPNLPNQDAFFINNDFFSIDTQAADLGAGDVMFGNGNHDIMLGGQGDDILFGGADDDDMIGGHNVRGGMDDLDGMPLADIRAIAPEVLADLNPSDVNEINDIMDGGTDDDVMAGDNAYIIRQADLSSPRFRNVGASGIAYELISENVADLADIDVGFKANVTADFQDHQDMTLVRTIHLLDHDMAIANQAASNPTDPRPFGNDIMTGGADDDELFGQLGDDIMQGDGTIEVITPAKAVTEFDSYNPAQDADPSFDVRNFTDRINLNPTDDTERTLRLTVAENLADGDDYLEGNGGNDRMYGNLGQDDIIGGSSTLFGLGGSAFDLNFTTVSDPWQLRPDGADMIYGGAGNPALLARNADFGGVDNDISGDTLVPSDERHATDADTILGDNGDIFRLVDDAGYLQYNYDYDATTVDGFVDDGYGTDALTIRPRVVNFADYGYHYEDQGGLREILTFFGHAQGAGDLIFGESGDDVIHGMFGNDVLFGNSEHDDLYGEIGTDYILGGTGIDGILGDDGLIWTRRNDLLGESLYGIAPRDPAQGQLKPHDEVNFNALNTEIATPGDIQREIINVANELIKGVELFSYRTDDLDNQTIGQFGDRLRFNDIIFGGLQNDFIHGGDGDDAISGAEALPAFYDGGDFGFAGVNNFLQDMQNAPPNNVPDLADQPFWFSFAPYNPGDILRYEGKPIVEGNGQTAKTTDEFAWYDEFNPRRKIMFNYDTAAVLTTIDDFTGTAIDFLLNFDETEGPDGVKYKGDPIALPTDGDDRIFGDLGNDWLVGGTGRDHMYAGRGDDFINMDDNLNSDAQTFKPKPKQTPGDSLENTLPDEYQAYADIAYGGAGRDVLLLNTGADRAIDWVGEFNSYIVPFSPFGAFHISRTLQPQLPDYLEAIATSDGADVYVDETKQNNVLDGQLYVDQKQLDDKVDDPDVTRLYEPYGELGMVRQTDDDWQAQTGAPNDPQAGNQQGKRDIMRRELLTDTNAPKQSAIATPSTQEQGNNANPVLTEVLVPDVLPVTVEATTTQSNSKKK